MVSGRGLEELVVQDEKDQEDEADDDAYGNQFLLFGPAAQKAIKTEDRSAMRIRRKRTINCSWLRTDGSSWRGSLRSGRCFGLLVGAVEDASARRRGHVSTSK